MRTPEDENFKYNYQTHLNRLKLGGRQPATIDAYARAVRRIGARFEYRLDNLSLLVRCNAQRMQFLVLGSFPDTDRRLMSSHHGVPDFTTLTTQTLPTQREPLFSKTKARGIPMPSG
uniref:Phage integrase, N-terminal SAM-like domain n=1 Tax=Candidatus Kentrum sp. DK TaxID=2126562 RepID=A0A450T0Q2_9GAMM|nr:MAG: hypothetical protein BECKDK2373C_GA0170839_10779 [Candidatus Kentron sp. DK]